MALTACSCNYFEFAQSPIVFDPGVLADIFQDVLTGQRLPADVAQQIPRSSYLRLYDPTQVDAIRYVIVQTANGSFAVQSVQEWTDLAIAFVSGAA